MVFSSAVFLWLFLPIVFLINLILPKKFSNIFLLLASLFFYAWGEPVYVILMVITITINWLIGVGIGRFEDKKKLILALGVIADVGILGYFKYTNFLVDTINKIAGGQLINPPGIILPIGISFFTFQAISYIVDVYRKDTEPSKNFVNVALYIAFFPQLIAGPIVKYKEINKQIEDRAVTREGLAIGFRRFIYGLAKKVIIANILAQSADRIFDMNLTDVGFKTAWIGVILYGLQMYNDFSGYSDMAIGLGRMFGFFIPENFDYPHLSKSMTEFWRRWHISLGSWFREYVYFPLGGSRKGEVRTAINLMIMFMLTGLWHGASFSYIFFGFYMGFFMVIERFGFKKAFLDKHAVIGRIYALLIYHYSYTMFRINNLPRAAAWMGKMTAVWRIGEKDTPSGQYMNATTWFILGCAILGCGILQSLVPESVKNKWKYSLLEWAYLAVLLILSIALIASATYNPFIYFQF